MPVRRRQIRVKLILPPGREAQVEVNSSASIAELADACSAALNVPADRLMLKVKAPFEEMLIGQGARHADTRTLAELLSMRRRVGRPPSVWTVHARKVVRFSVSAPDGRQLKFRVTAGTRLAKVFAALRERLGCSAQQQGFPRLFRHGTNQEVRNQGRIAGSGVKDGSQLEAVL